MQISIDKKTNTLAFGRSLCRSVFDALSIRASLCTDFNLPASEVLLSCVTVLLDCRKRHNLKTHDLSGIFWILRMVVIVISACVMSALCVIVISACVMSLSEALFTLKAQVCNFKISSLAFVNVKLSHLNLLNLEKLFDYSVCFFWHDNQYRLQYKVKTINLIFKADLSIKILNWSVYLYFCRLCFLVVRFSYVQFPNHSRKFFLVYGDKTSKLLEFWSTIHYLQSRNMLRDFVLYRGAKADGKNTEE